MLQRLTSVVAFSVFLTLGGSVMAQKIPAEVKQVVAFIFVKAPDGKLIPNGTAFFVGVRDEKVPDRFHVYIVTAKHVVSETPGGKLLQNVYLRLDKRAGGTQTFEIPLIPDGPNRTVYFPTDPTVDLAVIPALPDEKTFDFKFLPDDLIVDAKKFSELKISEGSDVFFTGLFAPHLGQQKNYPVVRFGRVALITDEKVNWGGTLMDLYLIESSSFGGNSGSPVFFYLGSDREPGSIVVGPPQLYLAGVMMGAFQDVRPIQVVQTGTTAVSTSNLGISAVVPAYKVREFLYSEILKNQRTHKP